MVMAFDGEKTLRFIRGKGGDAQARQIFAGNDIQSGQVAQDRAPEWRQAGHVDAIIAAGQVQPPGLHVA